jgi:ATP-dependent HslUV protease subunit HslV
MTTVAYRDGIMVSDTQCTGSSYGKTRVRKIIRLSDGSLFAGAGDYLAILALREWAEAGFEGKRPAKTGDSQCLLVRPDRTVLHMGGNGKPYEILDEFSAIGSGCDYALGAMAAGKSAQEAVEIAAAYDSMTSGPFLVESL